MPEAVKVLCSLTKTKLTGCCESLLLVTFKTKNSNKGKQIQKLAQAKHPKFQNKNKVQETKRAETQETLEQVHAIIEGDELTKKEESTWT